MPGFLQIERIILTGKGRGQEAEGLFPVSCPRLKGVKV